MKLLRVDDLEKARQKLLDCALSWEAPVEEIGLENACGRILAQTILAREELPGFYRSTVDGYAVKAADTSGAGESIPAFLKMAGDIQMGQPSEVSLSAGQCAYVPTGGMLPEGADAVVMVEYSERLGQEVAVYAPAAPGQGVVRPDEDIRPGDAVACRGACLRPQEIGALAAAGICSVPVYKPFRVTLISTGDELVAPADSPKPGQVRDVNRYALAALARRNGFAVVRAVILPDVEPLLEQTVRQSLLDSDLIAVSGGSSQGEQDKTHAVLDRVGAPGVFTHGLALKPGKPTILGLDSASNTLLAGLPGHPVSAMMVFDLLFCWLIRRKTGQLEPPCFPAMLTANVPTSPGKTTCQMVKLRQADEGRYTESPG
ncbi:gephyrin-like molybdotransferase Glp [Anaerotruncus colihominis]|uniref:molybdopterin molybdotransferase MoeA n=1 Tax=Anaerotruncus colihominis TaxID=169435 RepID=UPI003512E337